jgi:predicted  nucleic acid-binding Zn-ribbon protein
VATSADPEMQRLLDRQQALTEQIDDLRRRQNTMTAEEFDRQLETLVTELASVSTEIRRRQSTMKADEYEKQLEALLTDLATVSSEIRRRK